MQAAKKIFIIAPFWGNEKHVGHKRIERFIRWSSVIGLKVIIVKAGSRDQETAQEWGHEIMLKDPTMKLGFNFTGGAKQETGDSFLRSLLRKVFILFLLPDVLALWSNKVADHPLVQKHADNVDVVLSSSPPESAHIGSYKLANEKKSKLVIDMRDGWLDESLSRLMDKIPFRKNNEAKLEKKILKRADSIFVTSAKWKQLLNSRLEFTKDKTSVLPNGYPINFAPIEASRKIDSEIVLLHTGRFSGSRKTQKIDILLDVLLNYSKTDIGKFKVLLLGDLEKEELGIINKYKSKFLESDWVIDSNKAVPRNQMFELLRDANGLLLLSTAYAAVPSKLFEYIIARKPILAVALKDSALWEIGREIPQLFLIDYNGSPDNKISLMEFFSACKSGRFKSNVPEEFSDEYLSKIFYKSLGLNGYS